MRFLCHNEPVHNHGAESQSDWKPLMVATLSATEATLNDGPIPAAKTCISLVLGVMNTVDVVADNESVLRQLQARYQELKAVLPSLTRHDIPEPVHEVVNDLNIRLEGIVTNWRPRLTKQPRMWHRVLKLITASNDRNTLRGFVTETNQAINDFLHCSGVESWILDYRRMVEFDQTVITVSMPRAQYASYKDPRPGGARACLEGTCINLLNTIGTWALHPDRDHPCVFWLNGLAGTGKSTVAYTVASRLDKRRQLGGSFMFLKTDDQLNNGNLVFPTLAFQLSSFDPLFKSLLAQVLKDDPGCVTESPKIQFEKLIRQPLSTISISKPLILVLGALDECRPDSLIEILWVIVNNVKDIPFLRVFITSRPEDHIREGLAVKDRSLTRQKLLLREDMHGQEEVENDIRLYLKTSLQEIWQKGNQGEWPSKIDLETLVKHSEKLFIYAVAMVRYIGSNRALNLERQLSVLLNINFGHILVSLHRLDQLYLNILDMALREGLLDDTLYVKHFQNVVGSIVLVQKPLPLEALARFLGEYDVSAIRRTLYHLHFFIIVPDNPSHVVCTYHLSLPNFITDAHRCTNRNAYINSQTQELYLFLRCLDIMKKFYGPPKRSRRYLNNRPNAVNFLSNQAGAGFVDQPSNDEDTDYKYDDPDHNIHDQDFYQGDMSMTPEVRYADDHWCSHLVNICVKSDSTKTTLEGRDDALQADALEQLVTALEQLIRDYLSQWLDRRIARILLTTSLGTKMKRVQDTFDTMHNAHCWIVANIDSPKSWRMKQLLQGDAHETFVRLFPQAKLNYSLGYRLNKFHYIPWTEKQSSIITSRETMTNWQITIIASMPRAQYASYKDPHPGGARACQEGTRANLLNTIETWALHPDRDHPCVFWLSAPAGAGKSTIAYTMASRLDKRNQLGGNFMFLKTDDQLNNGNLVFPTLAFQLSSFDPLFKLLLAQVLENDPDCTTESPNIQFEKLIRQPLSAISISKPLVLILDALDECRPDSLTEILWVIVNNVKDIPFLRVFITSRPEDHIREGLTVKESSLARQKLLLREDMDGQGEVENDIRLYLRMSLQMIWQKENQGEWPSKMDLETLVKHSENLFIYAATVVRYIGNSRGPDLQRQLGVLLNNNPGHIPVSNSYRQLDQLYLNILDMALREGLLDDTLYINHFQTVVGSIVLVQESLPLEALACFLGEYDVPAIRRTLYPLRSIIIVPDDPSHTVYTSHLSFLNFITSADRCTNRNAYINSQRQELYLFSRCLDIMKKFYRPTTQSERRLDIRQGIVDSVVNNTAAGAVDQPSHNQNDDPESDTVDDLYEGDTSMTLEVRYANNHWCSHLVNIRIPPDMIRESDGDNALPAEALEQLISALEQFINDHLSQWLDQRIARMLSTSDLRKGKYAQGTLDTMYNAHRWIAANIDSRRGGEMRQILKTDAREAFARLFPETLENYTLGDRLNE
ncbi:hypothetical protein D9619_011788 [Psilocybe cf. subviscida]|uniref:Nephrocystin 3-like N-terminal domain-containing protein n=1 Tax=Psilocybe cf. subviscida TaxID=2480587 RepID=A0A8H5B0D5_9AGAR|nr:hypothetical protein D9619_011788 [Psilocybe cf. subviscida]